MTKAMTVLLVLYALSATALGQNQWENTRGPYGGTANSLSYSKLGYVLAATGKGLFVSQTKDVTGQSPSWV